MENKSHALAAGLFTIALLAAAILVALWFNRDRVEYVPYQIATKQSIPGLNPQAAVRYRGLDVGKVDDISFDPEVVGQILVHISVRPDTPITRSTFATLGYQGVTGIAYIQLDDDGSQRVKLESGPDKVARIEMRPSLFDQLQNRGLAILQQTEEVAKRINNLLQPENQEKILAAFDSIGSAANQLEAIPRQLQPTLQRMPALTAQAQQTLGSLNTLSRDASGLLTNLDRLSTSLQQPTGPIASITHSVDRVGMLAERLEYDLAPLTTDLGVTLRSLNRTLDNLNERPQSILFGGARARPGPGEDGFNED
ncbi:MlaD family protein [Noviherbaspirillum aridicola]|uniref:ABC transporter substrate-binding protein n=1 Tax=Noviherbaspirillum aridicola TaxID=2849687 RepID=A0ABQ4Q0W9_9BURK|nr:MlaD family protein [Noviherbaspirillum aridicola]GIZ50743.1 ABC transporter substrate-binding protein [Noviherbaspirillum aridicola]